MSAENKTLVCPTCGEPFHYARMIRNGGTVQPGIVVVCGHCAEVLLCDQSLTLRLVTDQDLREMSRECLQTIFELRCRIKEVRASRN